MEIIWKALAWVVSRRSIANRLIAHAQKKPYWHLKGYMNRYWLFNGYARVTGSTKSTRRFRWLPSIRIHQILREDLGDALHDHPWDARTIILNGAYDEIRQTPNPASLDGVYYRSRGQTARLNFEEYHKIIRVAPGGVWTMFFLWEYRGVWGFLVNGTKVKHHERANEFL